MLKEYVRMNNELLSYIHIHDYRTEIPRGTYHYHTNKYEIIYIISKKINYLLKDSEITLENHNLIIIPPMCIHSFKNCLDKNGFEEYFIQIDENLISNLGMAKIIEDGMILKSEENSFFHQIFKKIDTYYKELNEEDFVDILSALMKEVLYNIKIAQKNDGILSGRPASINPIITNALSYIYENYATIKSISQIAAHLYISERHLSKIFEKHLGTTPKKILMSHKLSHAKSLLVNGTKPIDVCYQLGFSDYTVFYRNFTSHFGYPPSKQAKQ